MPLDRLSRQLFPNQEQWRSRRQLKLIIVVLMAALAFAGIVGTLMYLVDIRR